MPLFCRDKDLSDNFDKTKIIMFKYHSHKGNEIRTRTFLGEEKVAFTRSYIYLGLTLIGPRFSLEEVACALMDMQPLVPLKTMCTHISRTTN